jgi:hypothetical protein
MKIEKSYLSFHIKLDWESTNMISTDCDDWTQHNTKSI